MPRRTAELRHRLDDAPSQDLVDTLIAFHHPTRRWLCELLSLEGPASVGRLAARTGLAVGSVSHHLKPLHEQGFIEPAPELARDTRESWWRVTPRDLTWSVDELAEGSMGRKVAERAEVENFRHQVRAIQQWLKASADAPPEWRHASVSTDTVVMATVEQLAELQDLLSGAVSAWSERVRADAEARPDEDRRPVRAVARCFPTTPVRP